MAIRSAETTGRASVLGPALKFLGGELSSAEDLVIEGMFEGTIAHHDNMLTITRSGIVKANIHAKIVVIEGRLEGDIIGDECVRIVCSAHVIGNVTAPSVTLESGADFDGRIKTTGNAVATSTSPSSSRISPTAVVDGEAAARAS